MSEIIGKVYNPYAMSSNGSGLLSGFEYGRKLQKERGLASGFANYVNAKDEEEKKAALSEMGFADPNATIGLLKAQKQNDVNGGFRQFLTEKAFDKNTPPEQRKLYYGMAKSLARDPYIKGNESYQNVVGKQQAEAGQPYYQEEDFLVDPLANMSDVEVKTVDTIVPKQKPVTAASLAADKKAAEEDAKNRVAFEKDLAQSKARLDAYDALRSDVEQNANILRKMNAINYGIGEWTDGLFGLENDERQKYAYIKRQIGEMRSNLINRARQAGQTGINTAKEIEIAAAGIDFDMSAPSLIGAIEQLKKQELRLDNAMAEYYGLGGVEQQPKEDVISVDEWLKQGR